MYLCEEYLERHNIKIPYVKHVHSGCVFFKPADNHWCLLTIVWKEPTGRPGIYHVRIYEPIHNGFKDGLLFEQINEKKLFLDEYEDYFLEWRKGIVKVARGPEVQLTAWEICLRCYDGLLANYVTKQDFLSTIDHDLTVESRLKSLDKIMAYFKEAFPLFLEAWEMDVRRYTEGYAHWLAELVHGNTESS